MGGSKSLLSCSQVCREFQRGNCTRGENDCRYAHPMEAAMVDGSENSVIVCMDYIKGRCTRDKCKYFHPPAHLQARIKAAQHQASQNAAAMVSYRDDPITMTSQTLIPIIMTITHHSTEDNALWKNDLCKDNMATPWTCCHIDN